jgi:hypothetical protein
MNIINKIVLYYKKLKEKYIERGNIDNSNEINYLNDLYNLMVLDWNTSLLKYNKIIVINNTSTISTIEYNFDNGNVLIIKTDFSDNFHIKYGNIIFDIDYKYGEKIIKFISKCKKHKNF